jgi:hypothetical protein
MRRRRRRKKNPTQTEWTEIAGGAAATLSSLFWSPRAGGLIGGGTAIYSAFQGHKQRAAIIGILSGIVFFSPELRSAFGGDQLAKT